MPAWTGRGRRARDDANPPARPSPPPFLAPSLSYGPVEAHNIPLGELETLLPPEPRNQSAIAILVAKGHMEVGLPTAPRLF